MKVAITSTGNNPEANLDVHFGRCSYFVIYDTQTHATTYIPNPNKEHLEGAGPASVQLIASHGAMKVVSGEFGLKVKSIFDSLKIQLVVLKDPDMTIGEIIKMLSHKN
jgi:predicted Fe-Mo cluster-binding NifX family protein